MFVPLAAIHYVHPDGVYLEARAEEVERRAAAGEHDMWGPGARSTVEGGRWQVQDAIVVVLAEDRLGAHDEPDFELDVGDGIEVVGAIDHVTRTRSGGIGIVDWKTNRKAKPRHRVAGSLQLAIYTLAAVELWGQQPEWVALDFVVPGVRVAVDREEIDTDAALATIREVAAKVRAEAFEPTPSALCPWCDFRSACPAFDGEGPDLPGLAVVELRKLRRRRNRDEARIAELEELIRDRLGPDAVVEVETGKMST
jgi:putative RecB family exonuclease